MGVLRPTCVLHVTKVLRIRQLITVGFFRVQTPMGESVSQLEDRSAAL